MNRKPPIARRVLTSHGMFNVHHVGHTRPLPMRYIHFLMRIRWRFFFPMIVAHFLVANVTFGALYWLDGAAVSGADSYSDCFFFSIQTVLTIGYGGMLPANMFGNILVALEAFAGLIAISMMTGLIFVRVLNPSTAITFSRNAIINETSEGLRAFRFRVADQGQQSIAQAEMTVALIRKHGDESARFTMDDLPLVRQTHPALALTWEAIHVIDESSPLRAATAQSLELDMSEILVTFIGIDNRTGQTVVARHSYVASEIAWDTELVSVISTDAKGKTVVDFRRFHDSDQGLPENK